MFMNSASTTPSRGNAACRRILYNGVIHSMEGAAIPCGYIAIEGASIERVGCMEDLPDFRPGSEDIDLQGMSAYPGFIDAHTHLGMWEDGLGFEGDDGNEETDPSTPHLRALDAVNPCDRCFSEALAAGITTVMTGPGSANAIGGQWAAMKTARAENEGMDRATILAPASMKFALGENPKSIYHGKSLSPMTRMATAAIIREQLLKARRYLDELERAAQDEDYDQPEFDMKCEALLPVLKRELKAHFHCHRQDDIRTALRLIREFNLDGVLIHATEGSAVAGELAQTGTPVIAGPILCDRSKPEMRNLDPANAGAMQAAGVELAICTDHPVIPIQYLPLSAALCVKHGLSHEDALRAITIHPARICGIDNRVGSLAPGKDADIVVFDDDPLSVYASPRLIMAEGILWHVSD